MSEKFTVQNVREAFAYDKYQLINQARWQCFDEILTIIEKNVPLGTAVDIGCGIGYFAGMLSQRGLSVKANDGRAENIKEVQGTYPHIDSKIIDVQLPHALVDYRGCDLAFCAGLMYHLENPFQAIRNIAEINPKIFLLESQAIHVDTPLFQIVTEGKTPNQGLSYVALIPSESALIKMCYGSGFPYVYRSLLLPNHKDFKETPFVYQRRTILVATQEPLLHSSFLLMPEPTTPKLKWQKNISGWKKAFYRLARSLKQKVK